MKAILEKLLGSSWRTSTTGLIETAVLLGGAWLALPEATRSDPKVFIPALVAALVKTLKDLQTKDKAVSGTAATGIIVSEGGYARAIPPVQVYGPPPQAPDNKP